MQRVFVLDNQKHPLSPCSPARARMLLRKGKAAVFRRFPFTIILTYRTGGAVQPLELKLDPGSKTTGVALVQQNKGGDAVVFAADINHRGQQITSALDARRAVRRNRRSRKTRYRAPRFNNRTRPAGWLPPSRHSRVENCSHWAHRFLRSAPIRSIAVETVRFDMQKMDNPEISGVAYQQGTLHGYEVREYLLEKFGRQCFYCGTENLPLEVEHVVPRSRGGSNRVSNLTLSCRDCNDKKDNRDVREFLADQPVLLRTLLAQLKRPLNDAAAVNATRYAIGNRLKEFGLPVSVWSGGRTKFNRTGQHYPKAHWIDAACVGETGESVRLDPEQQPLSIKATGRGSRQMCRVDKYGFPRTSAKKVDALCEFRTGDIVVAKIPRGKFVGHHTGRIAVRGRPSYRLATEKQTFDVHPKYLTAIHRSDGYAY